jgi:exopolysaccharide biosynthesis polyprenyl glycosylphosphotransferase
LPPVSARGEGAKVIRPDQAADGTPRKAVRAERSPDSSRGHSRRHYILRRALAVSDLVAVSVALLIALSISPLARSHVGDAVWFLPLLPVWFIVFRAYGLYEVDAKKINHGPLDEIPGLFHSFLIGLLVTWGWYRVMPTSKLVLGELVTMAVVGLLLVIFMRVAIRRLALRWFGCERVLFVGQAPVLQPLLRKVRGHPEYGLEPIGLVTGRSGRSPVDLPVLGTLGQVDLGAVIASKRVERVIVIQADVDDDTVADLLPDADDRGAKVSILPQHVDALGPSVRVDDIEGLTLLALNPLVLPRSSRLLKRSMDVVGSGIGLLFLSPLMAIVAIAIKLDSSGAVLFRQQRIGKDGHRFMLNKFRTMVTDAEQRLDELHRLSDDPHWLKIADDPRITRVGRFLRLTSLDELPQLWNVLRGDMSLVGPRPLIASEDEQVIGRARIRSRLAPGITGLWQVLGRTTIPFEEMVKLDYLYVANWSLWTDVKLLARTVPAVVQRRGAN